MWHPDQRTSKQYKEFQDQLRGNVRKTDTKEAMIERTLRDEIDVLKTRLARVEEALSSPKVNLPEGGAGDLLIADLLAQAGQAQWDSAS
jgi:hypothetical protein